MLTKTEKMKEVFREYPLNLMMKSRIYNVPSPYIKWRDGMLRNTKRTETPNGVNLCDPELDIDDMDRFIKAELRDEQ